MARLLKKYRTEVIPALQKEFKLSTPMAMPRMTKITVSVGLGKSLENPKLIDQARDNIATITGQQPVITKAKKAISGFKLRAGVPIGLKVTLRRQQMYEFFDRFVNVALGRVRDFRGISSTAFDSDGNLNIGIREHTIFPEVSSEKTENIHGMQITISFNCSDAQKNMKLMQALGMPFEKNSN